MLRKLGKLSTGEFLGQFWQKKPLMIRQLITDPKPGVDANELAGLALEPGIESRVIHRNLNGLAWQVEHGPFTEDYFGKLPETDWTLLIQGIDHWIPECADLLNHFRFLPNWCLDDIMASFAVKGGSVGPHYDQYDVFLLQAEGRRKWQIGPHCNHSNESLSNTPLSILKHMEVTEEWVLEPGDCLYLPPGTSHYGVALDNCITLSIGFRSPDYAELLSSLADRYCQSERFTERLRDKLTKPQENPGEISSNTLNTLQKKLQSILNNPNDLARWFGEFITSPKHEGIVIPLPSDELVTVGMVEGLLVNPSAIWRWNNGSRFTYSISDSSTGSKVKDQRIIFCVDGESFDLSLDFASLVKLLCLRNMVNSQCLREHTKNNHKKIALLTLLINKGSLTVEVVSL